ncbi:MAG: PDZ domain-containing protein [Acidobacteria bacterium]|nr:PDZ domain-containing protein [Acidobacteriota bacterium]
MPKRPSLFTVAALAIVASGVVAGALFGQRTTPASEHDVVLRAGKIAGAVLDWLPEKEAPEEVVYDGIDGMLEKLDPHSNFLRPKAFQKMRERTQGSFFGIGVIISRRAGKVTIIAPIAGTPAARKGLRAGDVIATIEGESTEDMSLDDVVNRIRGPEGTVVHFEIKRPGMEEPLKISITRGRIPTNSVRYAFMLRPTVGYLRLTEFSGTSTREVQEHLQELLREGATSMILDLRDNPGGSLDAAVGVSDTFLAPGQLIVSTRGRTKDSISTFKAPGKGFRFDGPLLILVNTGSASASEIVSGAVQDHDRGLIVGEVTWGKGLVQTVFTVRDAGLALTTARYYTPSGRCIQRDYHSFIEYITHRNGNTASTPASYHTDDGRPLKGGGGITPDVLVKARKLSEPVARLYGQSAFFRFAVTLLANLPEEKQREMARDFKVDVTMRERFLRFVRSEKLLDEKYISKLLDDPQSVEDMDRSIQIEVLNSALGLEAGYRVAIRGDNQIAAALDHLKEAQQMWDAWHAAHPDG